MMIDGVIAEVKIQKFVVKMVMVKTRNLAERVKSSTCHHIVSFPSWITVHPLYPSKSCLMAVFFVRLSLCGVRSITSSPHATVIYLIHHMDSPTTSITDDGILPVGSISTQIDN